MVGWSTYHLADIYAGKEKKEAEEGAGDGDGGEPATEKPAGDSNMQSAEVSAFDDEEMKEDEGTMEKAAVQNEELSR